jgi:DNA-binding beta-propeller fold protein YncE
MFGTALAARSRRRLAATGTNPYHAPARRGNPAPPVGRGTSKLAVSERDRSSLHETREGKKMGAMSTRECRRHFLAALLAAVGALAFASGPATAANPTATRSVLVVGNNWDGTADLVDPHTFQRLTRVNIVPDLSERLAEIYANPVSLVYYLLVRQQIGEGHDQLVDDGFTSHDGRFLYVSRPSLADVVAIDLVSRKIVWRAKVDGNRADHMAISPDGTRLAVSASTANVVDMIDTATGKIVGKFPSGDSPHENNYSRDGNLIFHASIGRIYIPLVDPPFGVVKGDRWFEVVDAHTFRVLKRVDIGERLAAAGYTDLSSAVRPMAISPDERYFYFQLSFFHGFVEYDLQQDRILRVARLPVSAHDRYTPREQYILNSAHHGLASNPDGTKLCAAGTMDNYIAIVSRQTLAYKILDTGERPYWSTTSADGRYCFVSIAGENRIAVVDYETEKLVGSIPVGYHPQRTRMGVVLASAL